MIFEQLQYCFIAINKYVKISKNFKQLIWIKNNYYVCLDNIMTSSFVLIKRLITKLTSINIL
jgi:hypothetical protein